MFTDAKRELSELIRLVVELERADATLAAKPEIVPTGEWREGRARKEARRLELLGKYELEHWNR
ncbi:MAG: hypothetical protein V4793_04405 [Paraburkholderia tropica]|uniref:hypothetical protein n=1 Tax=Burkholderia gladioli TaxID=28095 RepID=UPI00163DF03B|nr:hypothetical protein [Burkholderia gladioli]